MNAPPSPGMGYGRLLAMLMVAALWIHACRSSDTGDTGGIGAASGSGGTMAMSGTGGGTGVGDCQVAADAGCQSCDCGTARVGCTMNGCAYDPKSLPPPTPCTPGQDETCNEDGSLSGIVTFGTCTADRTCACNAGSARSPYTGRCLSPNDPTGNGCEVHRVTYAVGEHFRDDCNECFCASQGIIGCTLVGCGAGGFRPTSVFPVCGIGGAGGAGGAGGTTGALACAFDTSYTFSRIGVPNVYDDTTVIVPPAGYIRSAAPYGYGPGQVGILAFPPCGSPSVIDISDLMRDILDPDVEAQLTGSPAVLALLGVDARASGKPIRLFERGDGGPGFLVGEPCDETASPGCVPIPAAVARLVADFEQFATEEDSSASRCMLPP